MGSEFEIRERAVMISPCDGVLTFADNEGPAAQVLLVGKNTEAKENITRALLEHNFGFQITMYVRLTARRPFFASRAVFSLSGYVLKNVLSYHFVVVSAEQLMCCQ